MQGEEAVGWDPVYVHSNPGLIPRLFVFYLLAVLLMSLVRTVKLAWRLGWFFSYRKGLLEEIGRQIHKRELGSASVLAEKLPTRIPERGLREWAPSPGADEIKVALGVLHRAESTFVFAWEECTATAQSMKRACMLTAILSFFVFACGGMQLLRGMAFAKSTGIGLIAGVMTEVLVYFAFGLLVCAVLYAAYDLFEGALSSRKTRWDYFCACAKDDLSK